MPATAPCVAAATPVAAMAAPTVGKRCHRQRCHLWEPACRRPHPALLLRLRSLPWQLQHVLPSPAMPAVGAGMPATAPFDSAATPVAAMAAPTCAAIASDAICGSRHAGDRTQRCCCDSGRCHGSSHQCCHCQSFDLWEPACRRRRNSRSPQSLLFRIPETTVRTPTSGLPPARMRC